MIYTGSCARHCEVWTASGNSAVRISMDPINPTNVLADGESTHRFHRVQHLQSMQARLSRGKLRVVPCPGIFMSTGSCRALLSHCVRRWRLSAHARVERLWARGKHTCLVQCTRPREPPGHVLVSGLGPLTHDQRLNVQDCSLAAYVAVHLNSWVARRLQFLHDCLDHMHCGTALQHIHMIRRTGIASW